MYHNFNDLEFSELETALKKAEKISNENCIVLHVIKKVDENLEEVFALDEIGTTSAWEEVIATFENGKEI